MFSIIMPVWNRAYIVERAINSVISQDFRDYELIIIDDGSEDNLKEIVQPYLSQNIKYYKIRHQGAAIARNYGLEHSSGEFIAYLDSDNMWHPNFLSEMDKILKNDGIKTAYCMYNFFEIDELTGKEYINRTIGNEFVYERLFVKNFIDLNTFVHSRKCIEDVGLFDTQLKRLMDWDFILRITSRYKPVFVKKVLVDYYWRLTGNAITLKEDYIKAFETLKNKFKKKINIEHDTIQYTLDFIPDRKYFNWLAMKDQTFNTTTFKAPGFPYMLQIEVTNICNLACTSCPAGRNELNRKRQHMKFDMFKSIVDDMRKYLLFLVMWDWGEPFLNPELPEMIEYASKLGIKTVSSTNGHFLGDNDYVKRILKSGLSSLIIAIDSIKKDTYKSYRQGGDLNKVISGLKNVLRLKKELNSDTLIHFRTVIMKQNEHELKKIRRFAKALRVDLFTVKTANPSCGLDNMDEEMVPNNPKYRRYKYKNNTLERIRLNTPCWRVWNMSNILSNGDVVPCCNDYNGELKVGNVNQKPFSEIWNSPAYRELREKIYFRKDSIPKCKECTINFKLSKTGWFVESYEFNLNFKDELIKRTKRFLKKFPLTQKIYSKLEKIRAEKYWI